MARIIEYECTTIHFFTQHLGYLRKRITCSRSHISICVRIYFFQIKSIATYSINRSNYIFAVVHMKIILSFFAVISNHYDLVLPIAHLFILEIVDRLIHKRLCRFRIVAHKSPNTQIEFVSLRHRVAFSIIQHSKVIISNVTIKRTDRNICLSFSRTGLISQQEVCRIQFCCCQHPVIPEAVAKE